jgi:hypothetical protein
MSCVYARQCVSVLSLHEHHTMCVACRDRRIPPDPGCAVGDETGLWQGAIVRVGTWRRHLLARCRATHPVVPADALVWFLLSHRAESPMLTSP